MEINFKNVSSVGFSTDKKYIDMLFEEGVDGYNQGDCESALICFEEASTLGSECAQLFGASMYFLGIDKIQRNPVKALVYYKMAADQWENRTAQYFIGMTYLKGDEGVTQDVETGLEWLRKSANNGYCSAQTRLGLVYQMGDASVKQDSITAIYWYQRAIYHKVVAPEKEDNHKLYLFGQKKYNYEIQLNNVSILNALKSNCLEHLFSPKQIVSASLLIRNIKEAKDSQQRKSRQKIAQTMYFYLTSIDHGCLSICQFNLGNIYNFKDLYQESSFNSGNTLTYDFTEAARHGHRFAQLFFLLHRRDGMNFQEFYTGFYRWYTLSQLKETANTLLQIGCFHHGPRVTKTYSNKQFELFLDTLDDDAESNVSKGEEYCKLGNFHELDYHPKYTQDYAKAIEYYKKAQEEGFALGATLIGILYEQGRGVEFNYKKAFYWYSKGAAGNCPIAQFSLGWMYMCGSYVNTDINYALQLFKKSRGNGFKVAAQEGVDLIQGIKQMSYINDQEDNYECEQIYKHYKNIVKTEDKKDAKTSLLMFMCDGY